MNPEPDTPAPSPAPPDAVGAAPAAPAARPAVAALLTAAPVAPAAAAPRRATARFMLRNVGHFVALGFGSGLSPVAPGTAGTLYGWLLFVVLDMWLTPVQWGVLIAVGFVAGIWLCGRTARALNTQDPSAVVWDEIVAFWAVLWLITPASLLAQALAFALFRFFDAAKPGPVGWADRTFHGGFGIMFDDALAAGCTLLVWAVGVRLWGA
ncbi:MAG: phosphatidylglycerophosphatase A [Betaproteobacteria bacterium]|nr:phosphatidylglycerophosphatase A [Betaproteobacteria bacterium]